MLLIETPTNRLKCIYYLYMFLQVYIWISFGIEYNPHRHSSFSPEKIRKLLLTILFPNYHLFVIMSLILPKSCLVPNAIFTSLFAQGHKAQWPPFSLSVSPIHRLSEFQNKPGKVIAKGKFKVTTKYGSSIYNSSNSNNSWISRPGPSMVRDTRIA